MNWYKAATEAAVAVTPAEFGVMDLLQKRALALNESITPETQFLFFTEDYKNKGEVLYYLARNPSITPEVQPLFFTEEYAEKNEVLWSLARNPSITLEAQRLFFTESYESTWEILSNLAINPNITPEVQPLFITERYEKKDWVLENLVDNPSFLCDFTREQLLQIKNAARGNAKLLVLSKRLEQIAGAS